MPAVSYSLQTGVCDDKGCVGGWILAGVPALGSDDWRGGGGRGSAPDTASNLGSITAAG